MTQYNLVLLVAIITNTLYGQTSDDLRALSTSDDPQVAAKAYKDLALEQCTDSLSLHVMYAKQGIALARFIGNDTLVGNILMNLGTCHEINHKFDQAIAYFDSSEAVFLNLEGVDDWLTSLYINYGAAYYYAGMRSSALDYWLKAYERNGEDRSNENLGILMNNIANTYEELEKYEDALTYYQKSLAYKSKREDQLGYLTTLMNLGRLQGKMGKIAEGMASLQQAKKEWMGRNRPNDALISQIYQSEILLQAGRIQEAADLILPRVNDIASVQKNTRKIEGYFVVAQIYNHQKNCSKAIQYYEMAQQIVVGNQLSFELSKILDQLADCYAQEGLFADAYEVLRARTEAVKSTTKDARLRMEQEMQAKFNTLQKEQENKYLQAQNDIKDLQIKRTRQRFWLAAVGLLISMAFVIYVYVSKQKIRSLNRHLRSQRDEIQISLEEKEILLKEIHHRVKNNLQVISSLLGIQSRQIKDKTALDAIRQGRARVESMSLIHQDLYQKDSLIGVDLQCYFKRLVKNLFDTYNLSTSDITLTADIDPLRLDVDSVIPLGLVINELISNALKYAFPNDLGQIHVNLKETEAGISLSVRDNGIGMKNPDEAEQGDSFGYDLIQSLVDKMDGTLEIIVNEGTEVRALLKDFVKAA